jgi:multisubunit Na+/H+ antiporter MnhF subunit
LTRRTQPGLDTLYLNGMLAIVVHGMRTDSGLYFEGALILGMIGFTATVRQRHDDQGRPGGQVGAGHWITSPCIRNLASATVAVKPIIGMRTDSGLYFEGALILGMIGFTATVALAKFLMQRSWARGPRSIRHAASAIASTSMPWARPRPQSRMVAS